MGPSGPISTRGGVDLLGSAPRGGKALQRREGARPASIARSPEEIQSGVIYIHRRAWPDAPGYDVIRDYVLNCTVRIVQIESLRLPTQKGQVDTKRRQ
jgi:hypothetical protein